MKLQKLAKRYVGIQRRMAETTDEMADFGERIRMNSAKSGGDYGVNQGF